MMIGLLLPALGCTGAPDGRIGAPPDMPDARTPIPLSAAAARAHHRVMVQHLESVQAIVAALAAEDFQSAQKLTEAHLGFAVHRQAMADRQPGDFPPAYHDLAMAHHEAAEALARIMPSKDFRQIVPKLNDVLKACVACHQDFRVPQTTPSSRLKPE
jgi:hypothetical protein